MPSITILVIDDDVNLRQTLALILEQAGYRVVAAAHAAEGWQYLTQNACDLVFLDIQMPKISGLELLPQIRTRFPKLPVLILTAYPSPDTNPVAWEKNANGYLLKPIEPEKILAAVRALCPPGPASTAAEQIPIPASSAVCLALSPYAKELPMSPQLLQPGQPAPNFTLLNDQGVPVKLSDFRGRRVILYFYPKDDTPGCTTQACGFRDKYPQITEHNAVVLGISPDGVESHQQFKSKYNLPFMLLADPDHKVAETYGVWSIPLGLRRSHFIIDAQGNLEDLRVQISPTDSVAQALAAVGGVKDKKHVS